MTQRRIRTEFILLIVPTLLAFASVRVVLYVVPGVGGSQVAGYHVHHLLIGILLVVLGGVPAILIEAPGSARSAAIVAFGLGLGLALDEWVLFVLREASPGTAYSSRGSVLGACVLTILTVLYAFLIRIRGSRRDAPGPDGPAAADPERRQSG